MERSRIAILKEFFHNLSSDPDHGKLRSMWTLDKIISARCKEFDLPNGCILKLVGNAIETRAPAGSYYESALFILNKNRDGWLLIPGSNIIRFSRDELNRTASEIRDHIVSNNIAIEKLKVAGVTKVHVRLRAVG